MSNAAPIGAAPEQRGDVGEGGAALLVCGSAQPHDVMAALLEEHADDALQAVADEIAAHFHRLLLARHQLRPAAGNRDFKRVVARHESPDN